MASAIAGGARTAPLEGRAAERDHSRVRGRRAMIPAVLLVPSILVALVIVGPILYLGYRAASAPALWSTVSRPRTLEIVGNSVVLVLSVSIASVVIAVPLAWLTTRTDLAGKDVWATLAAMPLVMPACVGALAYISAFGPAGLLQSALEPFGVTRLPSIYGFWGAWLSLTMFSYPYVLLSTRAALKGIDPSQEEAARSLGSGPWRTFFQVTLPQLRPAIMAGAIFAALYSIGDFGVVTLMRYDAFTRAIYNQYRSVLDRSGAAVLALMLIVVGLLIVTIGARLQGSAGIHRVSATSGRKAKVQPLGRWRLPATLLCGFFVGLSLFVPIAVLVFWVARSLWRGESFDGLGQASMHSIVIGLATAAVVIVAAVPVSVMIARYPGPVSSLTERVVFIGYAIPRIALALAFVTLGVRTPFYQTIALLVVACAVRFISHAVGPAKISLMQINPRIEEAARGLGASPVDAVRRVLVPLAAPGLLIGAAMVMLNTMKELPLTLLLAPAGYDTLATAIWTSSTDAAYGQASAPALLLIAITAAPTLLLISRNQVAR